MSGGPGSDSGGGMEDRFSDLCKKLGLDDGMTRQAMILFKESKSILLASMSSFGSTGSPDEIERFWSAFVLYCVCRLGKKSSCRNGGVTLCQILRTSQLHFVDFFKEMPQFCLKVGFMLSALYGSDWERRLELKELQANVVHLSLLSRYYKHAFQELFLLGDVRNGESSEALIACCDSDYYRFGWLLFLVLRAHSYGRYTDLVTSTNGLVSVLAVLIIHMPVCFRKFSVKDTSLFAKRSDKGINLVASLCEKYHSSEDELKEALKTTNGAISDILKKKPQPAILKCELDSLAFFDPNGLTLFENLMDESSLKPSLEILEKEYESAVNIRGELDERMFVNDEESVLGSGSLSGGAINLSGSKRNYDCIASPVKSITSPMSPSRFCTSPCNGNGSRSKMAPVTPVSTAMTTAKWLRNTISTLPSKPSKELLLYFSACDKDVTDDVSRRARIILGAIFNGAPFGEHCTALTVRKSSMMDAIWAEQRKMEALKLYYRVLESMCKAESQLLNGSNLTSLLSNERFHRCMLACCAEVVLATHKTVIMMFPAVLEKTGITAFDMSKVIESFVRHEESLPRELKRHLNSLEERLLESIAWQKGSSMYNSLIVAKPALSSEINLLGLLAEPMPSLDMIAEHHNISPGGLPPLPIHKQERLPDLNIEIRSPKRVCAEPRGVLINNCSFTSPVKDCSRSGNCLQLKPPPLQSSFATPTRPNPVGGGETCAETGITIFFSKISKLAAIRIRGLCERLQLSHHVLECVYCLFQQILNQKTSLFFNRHLDQIILCAIYGVAKISQLALTFKEIIFSYRKQPQCKPQVFRSVYINRTSKSRSGKVGEEHVDIITFYNEIFIPSVKPLLVELGSSEASPLKSCKASSDRSSIDGQFPGSPRITAFPNLPNMSPKKVSPAHNVYVSPLRSSKMDSLLSPSSKSYYACVGESTHAFQSPSKDLKAINSRLNSGRKVSGKLNFDMVSDLVVAGSLGDQPGPSPVKKCLFPIKCEQSST